MDHLIELLGRDTFLAIFVYVGSVLRAGKGDKVPVVEGLIAAFVPFFVIVCLIWLFEFGLGMFGLVLSAKVLGAAGGIGGFLGNSWIAGLIKNGKNIEENGAVETLVALIKSIVNLRKQA